MAPNRLAVAEPMRDAPRSVSTLLAVDDAENYPAKPMMTLLCLVTYTEGLDAGLFPAVAKALENTVQFNVAVLGTLAMVQFLCQAFGGPLWGVLASRAIMTRKQILTFGILGQGLATLIMWVFIENYSVLLILRGVNGICLAALRPIANAIVADRFDDTVRGKCFSHLFVGYVLGAGTSQLFGNLISEEVLIPSLPTFWGWKFAFVVVGVLTISLAPAIHFHLRAPPVKANPNKEINAGVGQEFRRILQLLQIPTFAILVVENCFGLFAWRAMEFRIFFFETAGLNKADASTVMILGGSTNLFGALAGGYIGDYLNKWWPLHGRVLAAEISVYSGIPIALMTFMIVPLPGTAFWWYFILTAVLGAVAIWAGPACDSPVLCSLVPEDERSLVLAWSGALAGAVSALGPFFLTFLMTNVFGYDPDCNLPENQDRPDCRNLEAVGMALAITTAVPWTIAGLMYSMLHYLYPRDVKAIQDEREQAGQMELAGGFIS